MVEGVEIINGKEYVPLRLVEKLQKERDLLWDFKVRVHRDAHETRRDMKKVQNAE